MKTALRSGLRIITFSWNKVYRNWTGADSVWTLLRMTCHAQEGFLCSTVDAGDGRFLESTAKGAAAHGITRGAAWMSQDVSVCVWHLDDNSERYKTY